MIFVKRPGLTLVMRLNIALLCQGTYGVMSQLANQYGISRA